MLPTHDDTGRIICEMKQNYKQNYKQIFHLFSLTKLSLKLIFFLSMQISKYGGRSKKEGERKTNW